MTAASPNPLAETRLRENVFVWTFGGDGIATSYGANCTAVIGKMAVLLVDPFIAPVFARLVEERLREMSPVPVRHVLLTHHHTDHALGAGWFASRGVEVIAHPACRAAMAAEHPNLIASRRRQPDLADLFGDAKPYLPSRTFDEELTLDLGGTPLRCSPASPSSRLLASDPAALATPHHTLLQQPARAGGGSSGWSRPRRRPEPCRRLRRPRMP